jgi:Tfp pilus assembly protein PilF
LRFFDERSCLKLIYATMLRPIQRWHGVPMIERHREQLRQLRQKLGISMLRHAATHRASRSLRKVKEHDPGPMLLQAVRSVILVEGLGPAEGEYRR